MKFLASCLLLSASLFSSCKGENPKAQHNKEPIAIGGDTVSSIDKSIWVIYQDKKNNYWFGSNGKGVYRYDGKTIINFNTTHGLSSDQIRGIQEDTHGNIFFDTPSGVTKFDGTSLTLLKAIRSNTNDWKSFPSDLWFKGNGNTTGAFRYDGQNLYELEFPLFNPKAPREEHAVYTIYKDQTGAIWFGTLAAGVCRFNGTSFQWLYEKELGVLADGRVPAVRNIIEDKDGNFWFSNILHKYKIKQEHQPNSDSIQYTKLNGIELLERQAKVELPYFTSAVKDQTNLWMSSYNEGVWKYNGNTLNTFKIKEGNMNVLIISIYKDNSGTLWLATDNNGVYKFNGTAFEKLTF